MLKHLRVAGVGLLQSGCLTYSIKAQEVHKGESRIVLCFYIILYVFYVWLPYGVIINK